MDDAELAHETEDDGSGRSRLETGSDLTIPSLIEGSLARRVDFDLVGPESRDLPALTTPPGRPAWQVRGPLISTATFAGASVLSLFLFPFSGPFAIPIFLCSAVILSAFWFFMSLVLALVWREWQHGNLVSGWERDAIAEFGAPYDRWRVSARERERGVELSLLRYVPHHKPGEVPLYQAQLVRSVEFSGTDEIEALETLGEWQHEAEEREEAARDEHDADRRLSRSAGDLAERLQAQLPRGKGR